MKVKIISSSYTVGEFEGKAQKVAHITGKGEDRSIYTLDVNIMSSNQDYVKRTLAEAGFKGEITDDNLRRLNGSVHKALDITSWFHLGFDGARPTRLERL